MLLRYIPIKIETYVASFWGHVSMPLILFLPSHIFLRYTNFSFIKNILVYLISLTCFFISTVQAEEGVWQGVEENFETSDDGELQEQELPIIKSLPGDSNNSTQAELKNCRQGKIIALNKITATSKELVLKTGESEYFGNIKITLHKCAKNVNPYVEDNYILLTVTEHKIDEDPILLFQGWLISSSISLSTFEHPIYEIFAKECYTIF